SYSSAASDVYKRQIDGLYANAEPVWQSLLTLNLCTPEQIEEARTGLLWSLQESIADARYHYRNQYRYIVRWHWKGYPEHLEYPLILVDLMQAGNSEMAVPLVA
ncbi:hypothetical protein AB2R97_07240, partial [Pseudomonas fulva]